MANSFVSLKGPKIHSLTVEDRLVSTVFDKALAKVFRSSWYGNPDHCEEERNE